MNKEKVVWMCAECGHTQPKWAGSCFNCSSWNSFVQQKVVSDKKKYFANDKQAKCVRLKDVNISQYRRISSNISEFDRVLGKGVVIGSLILIGGDPGIGKSTLLMQLASAYAIQGIKVLYICGEESQEQVSLRAQRLNIDSENLYLLAECQFSHIRPEIENIKPDVIVVDSVQILYKEEIPSAPGSVVQVREIAMEFMHIAKGMGVTTFMIGHVTKTGEIAGPRVLEHIVDTVLDFEGERQMGLRLLRSVKNRFGPTDDVALFEMKENGLNQLTNPSVAFLQERHTGSAGSAVVATIEGIRPLLIEVQALVTQSAFSNPTRKSAGLDNNRLALLLAVLEKKVGYNLHALDVFVSLAGGIKIKETAIDLAVIMAIASSFSNKPIGADTVILGEVGLGGEIRSVTRIEQRIKEVINMGFKNCILPKKNLSKTVLQSFENSIRLMPVEVVDEALSTIW